MLYFFIGIIPGLFGRNIDYQLNANEFDVRVVDGLIIDYGYGFVFVNQSWMFWDRDNINFYYRFSADIAGWDEVLYYGVNVIKGDNSYFDLMGINNKVYETRLFELNELRLMFRTTVGKFDFIDKIMVTFDIFNDFGNDSSGYTVEFIHSMNVNHNERSYVGENIGDDLERDSNEIIYLSIVVTLITIFGFFLVYYMLTKCLGFISDGENNICTQIKKIILDKIHYMMQELYNSNTKTRNDSNNNSINICDIEPYYDDIKYNNCNTSPKSEISTLSKYSYQNNNEILYEVETPYSPSLPSQIDSYGLSEDIPSRKYSSSYSEMVNKIKKPNTHNITKGLGLPKLNLNDDDIKRHPSQCHISRLPDIKEMDSDTISPQKNITHKTQHSNGSIILDL